MQKAPSVEFNSTGEHKKIHLEISCKFHSEVNKHFAILTSNMKLITKNMFSGFS